MNSEKEIKHLEPLKVSPTGGDLVGARAFIRRAEKRL